MSITLVPDTLRPGTPPGSIIKTQGLDGDDRWEKTLNDQVPLRFRYRLELWRSRAFNDALERAAEWEILLRLEPLFDQYSLTVINRGVVSTTRRAGTIGALTAMMSGGVDVRLRPTQVGVYYYVLTVTVTALSDSELDDYERLIQGDQDRGNVSGGAGSSSVIRQFNRLLLRATGLPGTQLEARSGVFTVTEIRK